jgi:hypothetical protein
MLGWVTMLKMHERMMDGSAAGGVTAHSIGAAGGFYKGLRRGERLEWLKRREPGY